MIQRPVVNAITNENSQLNKRLLILIIVISVSIFIIAVSILKNSYDSNNTLDSLLYAFSSVVPIAYFALVISIALLINILFRKASKKASNQTSVNGEPFSFVFSRFLAVMTWFVLLFSSLGLASAASDSGVSSGSLDVAMFVTIPMGIIASFMIVIVGLIGRSRDPKWKTKFWEVFSVVAVITVVIFLGFLTSIFLL